MNCNIVTNILSDEEIKLIFKGSIEILEHTGVKVLDKEARCLLKQKGATINDDIVYIPKSMVLDALETVPNSVKLYDRNEKLLIDTDRNEKFFGVNVNLFKYLDPYTDNVIDFTTEHESIFCRVSDSLNNISFVTTSDMMTDKDIPENLRARVAFKIALENTSKVINFSTDDVESCIDIIDLASDIKGGKERLQDKPFIFLHCTSVSPLIHSGSGCQKLLYFSENKIPIVYLPYSMMGASSPMSLSGTLVQCFAEILSGLVIHQCSNPGSPFLIGSMPSVMDMKTTVATFGSPEFHLLVAASSEISNYFNIPFYGTAGCTDSQFMDYQAVMEATMSIMLTMTSKANIIHDIGYLTHGALNSIELTVLDNEIIEMLKPIVRGVRVEEHNMCLDVIKEVGCGTYLTHPHTFEHYKDVWYSNFLDRSMEGCTTKNLNEKIKDYTINLIENYKPDELSNECKKIINKHVNKWYGNI